ncbi:MAG: FecR domain-containing protein [Bacteroidota bacterium]
MSDSVNPRIDQQLLVRYLSEETTASENEAVRRWLNADDQNRAEFDQLRLLWESSGRVKEASSIDIKGDWQKIRSRIGDGPKVRSLPATKTQSNVFTRVMRVAAVITFLVLGYLAWPVLSDLGHQEMVTTTALNDTSTVVLPDGSKVVLNRNSRLVYPVEFKGNVRTVTLEGEAFFEVVEDPSKPFLIKTGEAITEVVGTSFTVNAGIKNKVLVTVLTGEVLLYPNANQEHKLSIVPGEQGQLKNGSELTKTQNEDINFLSWKSGILVFRSTPIDQVVQDLNTYYDLSIKVGSSALKSCMLTATFERQSFEDVLAELQLVLPIQIQSNEGNIILTGVGCK